MNAVPISIPERLETDRLVLRMFVEDDWYPQEWPEAEIKWALARRHSVRA